MTGIKRAKFTQSYSHYLDWILLLI